VEVVGQIAPTSRSDARGAAQAAPLGSPRPRRILVAYDASETARRALEAAADLAGYGSTLTVVSVADVEDVDGVLDDARERLLSRHVTASYVSRSGDPAGELIGVCEEFQSDLIVVGRRRQRALRRLVLGSVSARLVGQAPCDVLVVRERL
jgi:nucleotide-binding universal stress UspA family protein